MSLKDKNRIKELEDELKECKNSKPHTVRVTEGGGRKHYEARIMAQAMAESAVEKLETKLNTKENDTNSKTVLNLAPYDAECYGCCIRSRRNVLYAILYTNLLWLVIFIAMLAISVWMREAC